MTTAHPDDENNAMLAYYGHGKGFRAALVTATRGEGGQNEIGPELFEALAVLRTEELLAAHRYDGAEQYFTRAVDFGYSFGIEETLEKWGHQEILGDFVRMIRTIRPDVIVGFVFDGEGGGQHHQTSARLTLEAFRAAADPARFPEQIAEGLRPWQPKKYYYTAGFGGPGAGGGRGGPRAAQLTGEGAKTPLVFEGGAHYDPVLGRTCNEVSAEARSMHKCQGMSQLLPLPDGEIQFGGVRAYRLRDTVLPDGVDRVEKEPFDGIDTSLSSLATFAGANPPAALSTALSTISNAVKTSRSQLSSGGNGATVPSLAEGLTVVRRLRGDLASMPIEADGRFEIDFRLVQKEAQFVNALLLAADVKLDAVATDGLVVAGQPVDVRLSTGVRGSVPVQVTSRELNGFAQDKPEGLSPRTEGLSPPTGRSPAPRPGAPESVALSSSSTILSAAIPPDARPTAAHFKYRQGCRAIRAGSGCAVRFAVPADTVHCHVRPVDRRGGGHDDRPGSVPLRGQSVQRREAARAARGPGFCRLGVAGNRDRSGPCRAVQRPRSDQRHSRHGDQSHLRRRQGRGGARAAARMARRTRDPADQLLEGRRGDDRAIRARRAAAPGGGRGDEAERQQHLRGEGRGPSGRFRPLHGHAGSRIPAGLSSCGVPTHDPSPRDRGAGGDRQGARREREAQFERRLHHGCRRRSAGRAGAAWRQALVHRRRRARVG